MLPANGNGIDVGENMEVEENGGSNEEANAFPPAWANCAMCKSSPKTPDVTSLPCGHVCCSDECLEKVMAADGGPHCPSCRYMIDREELFACTYINDTLEMMSKDQEKIKDKASHENQICKSCVRESKAHRWCVECQEFLCEFCCEHHQYGKATRGHALVSTSEGIVELSDGSDASIPDNRCQLHGEDLVSYCIDCEAANCATCVASNHGKCKIKSLEEIALSIKEEFQANIETVKYLQERNDQAALLLASKVENVLNEQKSFLYQEIRDSFQRITEALVNREMEIRKELVGLTLEKAKELNIKKANAIYISNQCTQFLTSSKDILEKGSAWQILQHKRHIDRLQDEFLEMIKGYKDDTLFDQYTEKNCSYTLDKKPVQMAVKYIEQLGRPKYGDPKNEAEDDELKPPVLEKVGSVTSSTDEVKEETKTNRVQAEVLANQSDGGSPNESLEAKRRPARGKGLTKEDTYVETDDSMHSESESVSKHPQSDTDNERSRTSAKGSMAMDEESCPESGNEGSSARSTRTRRSAAHAANNSSLRSSDNDESNEKFSETLTEGRSRRSIKPSRRIVEEAENAEMRSSGRSTRSRLSAVEDALAKAKEAAAAKESVTPTHRGRGRPPNARAADSVSPETSKSSTKDEHSRRPARSSSRSTSGTVAGTSSKPAKPASLNTSTGTELVPTVKMDLIPEIPVVQEENMKISREDPNEDYCAVCLDGGGEVLICCDFCPKVFHLDCHLPKVDVIPQSEWQCFFCKPLDTILQQHGNSTEIIDNYLCEKDYYTACKFLCEIYKIRESLTVRQFYKNLFMQYLNNEVPTTLEYMRVCLARHKYNQFRYKNLTELVYDCRKMFYQAGVFYEACSKPPNDNLAFLKTFEMKFNDVLKSIFPSLFDIKYDPTTDKDYRPLILNKASVAAAAKASKLAAAAAAKASTSSATKKSA